MAVPAPRAAMTAASPTMSVWGGLPATGGHRKCVTVSAPARLAPANPHAALRMKRRACMMRIMWVPACRCVRGWEGIRVLQMQTAILPHLLPVFCVPRGRFTAGMGFAVRRDTCVWDSMSAYVRMISPAYPVRDRVPPVHPHRASVPVQVQVHGVRLLPVRPSYRVPPVSGFVMIRAVQNQILRSVRGKIIRGRL